MLPALLLVGVYDGHDDDGNDDEDGGGGGVL